RCRPSPGGRTAPPFARPGSHPADERRRTTRSCAGTPTPPPSSPPPAAPAPTNRRAGPGVRTHGRRGTSPFGARSRSPPRMTTRVVSMRSIRWLAALAAPLVILIFAALSLLRRDAPQYHGTLLDPPLPAHDFTLQSADGPVRLEDLRGDYVAVFFGSTSGPDVCPMTRARLATALRALGPDAQGMRVVMITVDPERDTPERLAQYTAAFGPEFIGLTGTPDEIASVAARFGIFYARAGAEPAGATATADEPAGGAEAAGGAAETAAGYLVDHSATVTVLDPEGRPRLIWSPTLGAEELAEDMRTLLRGRRAA